MPKHNAVERLIRAKGPSPAVRELARILRHITIMEMKEPRLVVEAQFDRGDVNSKRV